MQVLKVALITTHGLHDLTTLLVGANNQQAVSLEHGFTAFKIQQTGPVGFHHLMGQFVRVQLSPMPTRHTRTDAKPGKLGFSARQM